MDVMTLDKWVPFRNEGPVVRCRLFCFPRAAGYATFYRPLRRLMPPEVDFCPVELPGRAARLPGVVGKRNKLSVASPRRYAPLAGLAMAKRYYAVG